MRCYACNCILTNIEATRRFSKSRDFVDLCTKCLVSVENVPTVDSDSLEEDDASKQQD